MKRNLLLVLSVIGILISSYLAYAKLTNNPLICGANSGCDVVQASKYSTLFGIPLGIFGMGYYLTLFSILWFNVKPAITKILLLWGVMFSSYLTYLEEFVINAYCTWCVISFVNILLMAGIYFFYKEKVDTNENNTSS